MRARLGGAWGFGNGAILKNAWAFGTVGIPLAQTQKTAVSQIDLLRILLVGYQV